MTRRNAVSSTPGFCFSPMPHCSRGTRIDLMDTQDIRIDKTDRVLTITLHRPDKLNAFTTRMRDELIAAFAQAEADDDVRVVIVTGAGRAFCAGADLSAGRETFDFAKRGAAEAAAER